MIFEVPGPPCAKGRPRRSPDGHFYTPKRTKDYERLVGECALAAGLRLEPDVKYALEVTLYLSAWRGDLSNIVKAIEDGLNQYAKHDGWDDRQITSLIVRQVGVPDASQERAVVTVEGR